MQALNIFAGKTALEHIHQHGLLPQHVGAVAAAAGGPKGLMLLRIDKLLFGDWLARSSQPVHVVGASIGAWRMATSCLDDAIKGFAELEHGYIHGEMKLRQVCGKSRLPLPSEVSASFVRNLQACFGGQEDAVLQHPRYRLHVVTSRGRHLLGRDQFWRSAAGYVGAYLTNAVHRPAMAGWLERVVFSAHRQANGQAGALPFDPHDYRTRQVLLTRDNFMQAMQASGSIPFVLQAVHDIAGAPRGAYWDGGITDYHLHLRFFQGQAAPVDKDAARIVLYPHFQQAVVPGWLDKQLRWRHGSTAALDNMVLVAPKPEWVATLPNAKLPDRNDFKTYMHDHDGRVKAWTTAVSASQQLADELAQWLENPDPSAVQPL